MNDSENKDCEYIYYVSCSRQGLQSPIGHNSSMSLQQSPKKWQVGSQKHSIVVLAQVDAQHVSYPDPLHVSAIVMKRREIMIK